MKKSHDIIGLPVISIADGKEMGAVKSLVINPDQGTVEFMVVSSQEWQLGIKAIPFKLVVGIGEFAVTIDSASAIIDLAEIPIANDLLKKNIQIDSARMITRKGRLLGKAGEYYLDEESGKITGVTFVPNGGEQQKILPEEMILTFGREILVVAEDADSHYLNSIDQLETGAGQAVQKEIAATSVTPSATSAESAAASANTSAGTSQPANDANFRDEFEMRQYPFLVGKKVTSDIFDELGNLLVAEGETITEELFNRIRQYGRSKLIELTIKVED